MKIVMNFVIFDVCIYYVQKKIHRHQLDGQYIVQKLPLVSSLCMPTTLMYYRCSVPSTASAMEDARTTSSSRQEDVMGTVSCWYLLHLLTVSVSPQMCMIRRQTGSVSLLLPSLHKHASLSFTLSKEQKTRSISQLKRSNRKISYCNCRCDNRLIYTSQ